MLTQNTKCVMVVDETLPLGLVANTTAVLGATLGKQVPEVVGEDVQDKEGGGHLGIVAVPIPVLKAGRDALNTLRGRLYEEEFCGLTVVDFSATAQVCKTYPEYIEKMAQTPQGALQYYGLAICGDKKRVAKLTGSLPLLR